MKAVLYRLSSPSGKQYIGVTAGPLTTRMSVHRHSRTAIGSAVRKYKNEIKQEILVVGEESYIYELEDRAISAFNTMAPSGYNLSRGGKGGGHTAASRRKISEARKGIVFSEIHKQNLSKARGNRSPTKETRQKMVAAQRVRRAREGESERQDMSQKMKQIWAGRGA